MQGADGAPSSAGRSCRDDAWSSPAAAAAALALPLLAFAAGSASWPSGGQNLVEHAQPVGRERRSSPSNVGNLAVKWTATTHGDVSAIPAVVDGAVYVPDWGALPEQVRREDRARRSGRSRSRLHRLAERRGPRRAGGRRQHALHRRPGTQPAVPGGASVNGGYLFAVNATTGAKIWTTQIDNAPARDHHVGRAPRRTASSTWASPRARRPRPPIRAMPCCTFRGSVVAVDAKTGGDALADVHGAATTAARTPRAATAAPASGARRRRSTRRAHALRRRPATTTRCRSPSKACQDDGGTPRQCLDPNDHIDAIMALDADDRRDQMGDRLAGLRRLERRLHLAGSTPTAHATRAPTSTSARGRTCSRSGRQAEARVVGAGQKSGIYWALDAATGPDRLEQRRPARAPRSAASSGARPPTASGSTSPRRTLRHPRTPSRTAARQRGSWAALDPATGQYPLAGRRPDANAFAADALGPLSGQRRRLRAVEEGNMFALDAATGQTLWSFRRQRLDRRAAIGERRRLLGQRLRAPRHPRMDPRTSLYAFSINGN